MIHRLSLDSNRAAWDRAIERAVEHGYERHVEHVCSEYAPGLGFESVFDVESSSVAGRTHLVQLITTAGKTTTCSCPAGAGR